MPKHKKAKAETQNPTPATRGKSVIPHDRKLAMQKRGPSALRLALQQAMLGSETALVAVAHENNVEFRWAAKNRGMQAMNLGNVLAGMQRRGVEVRVEGQVVPA